MGKKKAAIVLGAIAVAAAAAAGIWYFWGNGGKDSKDRGYVEKVSSVTGNLMGAQNRYSGVVQPQETVEVNADSERTIGEVYVEVGDTVEAGTPLFFYDTEYLTLEMEQAKLELENQDIEISGYRNQIRELEKERTAAAEANKFEYTTQIQTIETQIKQAEFTKSSKQLEINKLQKRVDNSQVNSTASGIVKSIDDGQSQNEDTTAYMTILSTGEYRIKGTVNEQNVGMISSGLDVIIRSTVDEDITWTGMIESLDTEESSGSSDGDMMEGSDDGENASSDYSFYVTLDDAEGLMLGQHVLIELDEGQTEEKEGIWLQSGYIVFEGREEGMQPGMDEVSDFMNRLDTEAVSDFLDGMDTEMLMNYESGAEDLLGYEGATEALEGFGYDMGTETPMEGNSGPAYVWADNGKGKLEKRTVQLGEYDEELDQYEILSGLTEEDFIAWPMEGLYEGVRTVTDSEEVDYTSDLYNQETGTEGFDDMNGEGLYDDGFYNDGMNTEGLYDDGTYDGEEPYDDEEMYDDESGDGADDTEEAKRDALLSENGNRPLEIEDFLRLEGVL